MNQSRSCAKDGGSAPVRSTGTMGELFGALRARLAARASSRIRSRSAIDSVVLIGSEGSSLLRWKAADRSSHVGRADQRKQLFGIELGQLGVQEVLGQQGKLGLFEDVAHRELHVHLPADPEHQPGGQQGASAQLEEIVVA